MPPADDGGGQTTAQIFKPPYLYNTDGSEAARPVIDSAPDDIYYNTPFEVQTTDAALITRVSLVRLGAATHSFDQNQRFVPLEFTTTPIMTLNVAAPAHGFIAPPGYYMLFILKDGDRTGIWYPSVAKMVRLGPQPTE